MKRSGAAEKVRVLRVIARLNIGGPAIQTVSLTRELRGGGWDSLLVCGRVEPYEGDMSYLAREQGVEPLEIAGLGREISPLRDLRVLAELVRVIRAYRPAVIHTHTAKAGTLGRAAGVLMNAARPAGRRIRLVHTFHGHVFSGYFGRTKTAFFLWIERFLAKFTDRIVAVSAEQKRDICDRFRIASPDRVSVVPLGFDLGPFVSDGNPKGGLRERFSAGGEYSYLVGVAGRLAPVKNHSMLLGAARLLEESGRAEGIRFIIVGDGELRAELEQEAGDLGLAGRVAFEGWHRSMPQVYKALDAVALTSFNEGTPVSLIEAMAAGRPVVATAVGGVPDLLGPVLERRDQGFCIAERGILVRSGDVPGMAAALAFLRDGPGRASLMSDRARAWALASHGLQRLVNDVKGMYMEVLKTPGPA